MFSTIRKNRFYQLLVAAGMALSVFFVLLSDIHAQETILPVTETTAITAPATDIPALPIDNATTSPTIPLAAETPVAVDTAPADATPPASAVENTPIAPTIPLDTPVTVETTPEETISETVTVAEEENYAKDFILYKNYLKFQKYEQRELYKKFQRYRELAGLYPWENKKAEKKVLKNLKKIAKKYYKKPAKYPGLATQAYHYSNYGSLKAQYFSLKPYAGYGHLIRFDRDEYSSYANLGTEENRLGYARYTTALAAGKVTDRGDADLEAGALGPNIPVGIFYYIPKDLKDSAISIRANTPFSVLSRENEVIGTVPADTKIRVKYLGDKRFSIYYAGTDVLIGETAKEVRFVADTENAEGAIFDVSRPNSPYDRYRGSIKLKYYDSPEADGDRIWVINTLPLEQYTWGMGEITGVGPDEYDRVMTTIFRTYGYWKIKWSTKYADQGFKVDATSGSQIYYGYDWEITHPDIRKGAEATRGKLVMYDWEVALTPYSSWSDGKTRRFEDGLWGHTCKTPTGSQSDLYPWLDAVNDPRGRHETKNTCELASGGNHMVGLSANGAVRQAKYDGYTYENILRHYYSGIDLVTGY